MDKCNNCGTEKGISYIFFSESVKRKRNWEQEFLAKKGISKENDFQLCQQCQIEIKNYKAEEVVKELSQKNLVDSECFPVNYLKASNFTTEGAQKVQRAITENIKRHSGEWKIVRAKLLNSEREYYHDWNGDYRNNEMEILIHQSAKLEYGEDRFLKRETNKMYLKEYFPLEQWEEIEKKISSEISPSSQPSPKPKIYRILVIVGEICLISGIIFLFAYIVSKKKKKNEKSTNKFFWKA